MMIIRAKSIQLIISFLITLSIVSVGMLAFARSDERADARSICIQWFPKPDFERLSKQKGLYFIPVLKGYQQTTDYTCGPSTLMALAVYYRVPGITADKDTEMRIARETGTHSREREKEGVKPGNKPDELKRWLEAHGFDVTVEFEDRKDGSALKRLRANIDRGIPTIVEWADLGGHWAVVVGYDTRDNDDPWDDVIIMADSYDRYDDYQDGYSFVNANRFYWLWYDAFYFDVLTWRTMITATPKRTDQDSRLKS
jgi:hypothetical protein